MVDDPVIHQYVDDREERIIVRRQLLILGGDARARAGKWTSRGRSCFDFDGASAMRRSAQPAVTHRPAEYGVVIEKNLMIPVRDGVRLAADTYRPAREGKPAPGASPRS